MVNIQFFFIGFHTSQVVSRISAINSRKNILKSKSPFSIAIKFILAYCFVVSVFFDYRHRFFHKHSVEWLMTVCKELGLHSNICTIHMRHEKELVIGIGDSTAR